MLFGVGPILRVMQVAPSTYYAAIERPPSARDQRDERLKAKILAIWTGNRGLYGARKVWWQLQDEGQQVARCTVERLMRALGIAGATRHRKKKTTTPDAEASRPADLLHRDFSAPAPDRRWVAGITYIAVRGGGFVYAAFVIDLFSRMVVGWKVSASLRKGPALDALEMAVFRRLRSGDAGGLVHHSDRGSQYLSIRYGERLGEAGAVASVGSKGDSYDNAAAEGFNGLFKAELIWRDEPDGGWEGVADVQLATASYVDWFNNQRLHSACERMSLARFEAAWQETRTGQKPRTRTPGTGASPSAAPG